MFRRKITPTVRLEIELMSGVEAAPLFAEAAGLAAGLGLRTNEIARRLNIDLPYLVECLRLEAEKARRKAESLGGEGGER